MVESDGTPPHLKLGWTEADGPPVEPPRRGFGTRLIERSLTQDPGAEARIEFAPGGVTCTIDIPCGLGSWNHRRASLAPGELRVICEHRSLAGQESSAG
jgi:hypothetical protein